MTEEKKSSVDDTLPLSHGSGSIDSTEESPDFAKSPQSEPKAEPHTSAIPIPLAESTMPNSIGRLGAYEVLDVIGQGGMGVVLRAFDTKLHRNVAIKIISQKLISSPNARQRFFREARSAAAVNHPNVTMIYAADEEIGFPYLVMQLVEGQTLEKKLKNPGSLSLLNSLRISAQIASGLAAAHEQGIIHRDIKPGNILLENGILRAKISDFGLALLYSEKSDLTSDEHVVGTPSFMSPEQVEGHKLTVSSDLFSLGVIIYTIFAGKSPFASDSYLTTMRRIVDHHPPRLDQVEPSVPQELAEIVSELMQKNSQHRPKSAASLAAKLQKLAAEQTIQSNHMTTVLARRQQGGRHKWLQKIAGVVAVALVGAGYWYVSQPDGTVLHKKQEFTSTQIQDILADDVIMVGKTGEVKSITESLALAQPGIEIRLAAEEFFEPVAFTDAEKLQDVVFNGAGATLRAPQGSPIVSVNGIPGLAIQNLRCDALPDQSALYVTGHCPRLHVSDCEFGELNQVDAWRPLLQISDASGGIDQARIVIERVKIVAGGTGVLIGDEDGTNATPRHLTFRNCEISASGRDRGIPVVFFEPPQNVMFTHCSLSDGECGVSVVFPVTDQAINVKLDHCTFHNCRLLLYANNSVSQQDFLLSNCLLVDVEDFTESESGPSTFAAWMENNGFVEITPMVGLFKDILPTEVFPADIASFDPASENYLLPKEISKENWPGRHNDVLQTP